MPLHILSIVGARPQFVKAAMLVKAIREHNRRARGSRIQHTLVHTGQHYDHNLSDIFFQQLPLPKPQHNLGVGSGTHGRQTGELLTRIEEVLLHRRPDVVVLYGDTNSTVAGALAAAKLKIPIAHVEAGLRSFNRGMPEEINRVVTDHLSDILFCPTETAVHHLQEEGITKGVCWNGDVMLDAVLSFRVVAKRKSRVLRQLGLRSSEYILFTVHRAENTDALDQIAAILELLSEIKVPVVFPIHPRTRHSFEKTRSLRIASKKLYESVNIRVIDPVSYLDMIALENDARLIMTDSGGVQKEAYFLGVPCLTLRSETEWTETLTGGWNRLAAMDPVQTLPAVESLWQRNGMCPVGRPNLRAFGGGRAAETVVRQLAKEI
jgi:UDP-N-acetylglucosamine 2-epimerase